MKNKLFLIVFFACLICSCSKQTPKDGFLVELNIQGGENQYIYFTELNSTTEIILDSARIKNGKTIVFKQTLPYSSLFLLKKSGSNEVLCLIPHLGEKISISTTYEKFLQEAQFISSNSSSLMKDILEIQSLVSRNLILFDSLSKIWDTRKYDENIEEIRSNLDSIFQVELLKQKAIQIQKIDSNLHNLLPIFVYYQVFGQKTVFDLEIEQDFQRVYGWAKDLYHYQKGNPHIDKFYQRINRVALAKHQAELVKQREQSTKSGVQAQQSKLEPTISSASKKKKQTNEN